MKVVRTRRSVRLVDGRDLVSHLLLRPGPTHGFFDFLAACIAAFAPFEGRTPRALLLGFAAGGVVPPLRALGWPYRLDAVDLSLDAAQLFEEVAAEWGGDVRLERGEASAWLRRRRTKWDAVIEDLTVPGPHGAVKPAVSVETLPAILQSRLAPHGVIATNVLPVPGMSWDELLSRLAAPFGRAQLVHCDDYENRILLTGPGVPPARAARARLRTVLRRLGSRQADRFDVSLFRPRV